MPLTEEQQTSLSKAALVRILEGHKTIAAAGGGDLRVALLARLVAQAISAKPIFVDFDIVFSILRQHFDSLLQVVCGPVYFLLKMSETFVMQLYSKVYVNFFCMTVA